MNSVEHAVARPFPEIIVNRRPRREVLRQLTPLTPRAQYIAHRVHDFAHIGFALPAAAARTGDQRFDQPPFRIGQIAWVTLFTRRMLDTSLFCPHGNPLIRLPHRESHPIQMTQELLGQALMREPFLKDEAKRLMRAAQIVG